MKRFSISCVFLGIIFSGCAASHSRGVVAMRISDNQAHVCLGKQEAKPGDRVNIVRNECTRSAYGGKSGAREVCKQANINSGVISENLNEHYAVVQLDQAGAFREGDLVVLTR